MRICIVTPGHLTTNPRVVKEATALHEAGHEVVVICGRYAPWAVDTDDAIVRSNAWRVVATVAFGPHLASRARYVRQTVIRRAARLAWRIGIRMPRLAELAVSPAVPDIEAAARSVSADLYIAHYVPALPAVAKAAKHARARYGFDAEDYHPGDPPSASEHDDERAIIETVLARYLPKADFTTAASPLIAEAYARRFAISEPSIVLNVFPTPHPMGTATAAGIVRPGPSLYWVSQTIGPDRGLEEAVHACSLARCKPHLYLRGRVDDVYRDGLTAMANRLGIGGHVHFLPLAPPEQLESLAAEYDAGLCSETGLTVNHDIALANKIFSYLAAGIPPILSDTSAHRKLADELPGAAWLYKRGQPDTLASVLDRLFIDPDELRTARANALRAGLTRFNWDVEKKRLVAIVGGLRSSPQEARNAGVVVAP